MSTDPLAWLQYVNDGATRNKPLADPLVSALSFLPEMGVTMQVFSGGQEAANEGSQRTGSTRHDHGNAADVFFFKDGRQLDWRNPDDVPIFQQIVSRAKANGVSGFGAGDGYMRPGSMHIGFGAPSVWGAGGKGSNAPDWLRVAYGEAPLGNAPQAAMGGGAAQSGMAADTAPASNDYTRLAYAYANGKMTPEDAAIYERGMAEGVFPKAQRSPPTAMPNPLAVYQATARQQQSPVQFQPLQVAAATNATPLQRFPGI